ncbi:chaperone for protein-folding within the ER, fungal-domain-containing protein [Rhizoctonia solani]|nr:chaperone for protein-folding within the ER, fungal-domain-containing protein [Rhizoctonia solani]
MLLSISAFFATFISTGLVLGQVAYDSDHNVTSLRGTWGMNTNGHVLVGPTFFNPVNRTFTVPESYSNLTSWSWSYSFTDDGFWERCTYHSLVVAGQNCTASGATLYYQHGTYQLHSNGSISLTPFANDGTAETRVSPDCGYINETRSYDDPGFVESWSITRDPALGPTADYAVLSSYGGFKMSEVELEDVVRMAWVGVE